MKKVMRYFILVLVLILVASACKKEKEPATSKVEAETVAEKTDAPPAPLMTLAEHIAMLDSDDLVKRKEAVDQITLKGHGAVDPLLDAFETGSPVFKSNALTLLDKINPNWVENERAVKAVPFLIQMLLDPSTDTRHLAKKTLLIIGEPALDQLIVAMRGESVLLADSIAPIIMEIDEYWLRTERGQSAIPEFIKGLRSKNQGIKQNATNALARMGHEAFGHLMVELLDKDMQYRKRIRWIFKNVDKDWTTDDVVVGAVPVLIEALRNPDQDVRLAAAEALAEIKDARAFEPLLAAMDDDFYYAAKKAEKALGSMTGEDFGSDKAAWRAWWKEYTATLKKLEKEAGAEKTDN